MRLRNKLLASAAGLSLAALTFAGQAGAQSIESWGPSHTSYFNTSATVSNFSKGSPPQAVFEQNQQIYFYTGAAPAPGTVNQSGHDLGTYSAVHRTGVAPGKPGTVDMSGHDLGAQRNDMRGGYMPVQAQPGQQRMYYQQPGQRMRAAPRPARMMRQRQQQPAYPPADRGRDTMERGAPGTVPK
jgi:hypothetical protein